MIGDPNAGVAARSAVVDEMATHWPMIDALVGGTATMRAAAAQFLPKWPLESDGSHKARVAASVLFPAFNRTSAVLAAKPFARDVKIDGVPDDLLRLLDDVDLLQTDFQPFLAQLMLSCLRYGVTGVLVDMPPAQGVRNLAEEKALGIRPYATIYPAGSILGWRTQKTGSSLALTQIRLLERIVEDEGRWGERVVEQVRVLTPGRWETYRRNERGWWIPHDGGVVSLKRVPFVFFYGEREGFGVGSPPLIDLAHMNVEHWQSSSDQMNILHVARVPILFAKGFTDSDKIVVGANQAAMATNPSAELVYVEHTGKAIEAGRVAIRDLEDRMRQAGAELLVQRASTVTATEVRADAEGNRSTLQKIVEGFEESAEDVIRLMGEWAGIPCDPDVELYKDFGANDASDAAGGLLMQAVAAGVVSRRTAFEELQRMDVVSPGVDWDEEVARIAGEAKDAPADPSGDDAEGEPSHAERPDDSPAT